MAQTIRIVAHVKAISGKEEQLKAILLELVPPTRAEAGCIRYELLQSSALPNEFIVLEEWADHHVANAHMQTDHVEEAFIEAQDMLAEPPDIRWYSLLA